MFGFGNVDRDALDLAHGNLMRVTEVHNQILALLCYTVANAAVRSSSFLKPSVTPTTMLWIRAAGQAVQCAVVLVVVRTSDEDFVALHRDVHVRDGIRG